MHTVYLILYGDPTPKGRARIFRDKASNIRSKTPDKTASAEQACIAAFIQSGQAAFPPGTPLEITVTAHLARPASAPKKRFRPITRPDADNIYKLVTDALEKLAYDADSRIVDAHIHKHYAIYPDPPRTEITIIEANRVNYP